MWEPRSGMHGSALPQWYHGVKENSGCAVFHQVIEDIEGPYIYIPPPDFLHAFLNKYGTLQHIIPYYFYDKLKISTICVTKFQIMWRHLHNFKEDQCKL